MMLGARRSESRDHEHGAGTYAGQRPSLSTFSGLYFLGRAPLLFSEMDFPFGGISKIHRRRVIRIRSVHVRRHQKVVPRAEKLTFSWGGQTGGEACPQT